ncbi:MAG: glycoside hydrolase family 76 protein, partial [Fimbriimonas sp.]
MLKPDFGAMADRLSSRIEATYWQPAKAHYAAYRTESGELANEPAFAWDLAVQLTSLARAARVQPKKYRPILDRAIASMDRYWSKPGYSVLPGQDKPDRFYDDNAWICLALLEAGTSNRKLLQRAEETYRFVFSGEDRALGGGIYWHEEPKTEKNTCINAPAIVAALELYERTKKPAYLKDAQRLMAWIGRLQDADGLYFDNQKLDGTIDRTKW